MIAKQLKTVQSLSNKGVYCFAAPVNKKVKMELTLRTPYRTYLENFTGFSRVLTKSNESALVIQNKSPPAIYVLPPGALKVKLTQDTVDSEQVPVTGDYLHTGGWVIVGLDNTCNINLQDAFEKKEVRVDQFEKGSFQDGDNLAGKYANKLRKSCARVFTKKAAA